MNKLFFPYHEVPPLAGLGIGAYLFYVQKKKE